MQYQCAQAIGWMTTENCYREEERKGERVRGRMRKEEKEENIHFIHTCVEFHARCFGNIQLFNSQTNPARWYYSCCRDEKPEASWFVSVCRELVKS